MSNLFRVALLQLNRTNNEQESLMKGIEYCRKAKTLGSDIAVFPELWNNGYEMLFKGFVNKNMNVSKDTFDKWRGKAIDENSTYINTFRSLAKELDMAIAITLKR